MAEITMGELNKLLGDSAEFVIYCPDEIIELFETGSLTIHTQSGPVVLTLTATLETQ